MKWITKEEVKKSASGKNSSKRKALLCSIKHWQQLVDATLEDYKKYLHKKTYNEMKSIVKDEYCALCSRYYDDTNYCKSCPLTVAFGSCPGGRDYGNRNPWVNCHFAWDDFIDELFSADGHIVEERFNHFKAKAVKMLDCLKQLLEK